MYQKNLSSCTGNESPHLANSIKTADAINACFVKDWDDGGFVSAYIQYLKKLHLLCHFWSIDSLPTAPLLAHTAPAIFDDHCCRGYKERNHTAAPATQIKCLRTLLIHKKCNFLQKKGLLSQANIAKS